jgi:hypothetical protein
MRRIGAGRLMLTAAAGFTAAGGFLVDWNKTHLFNPDWPPHAKFHDAQSILLGSFLGASGLYFLWKKGDESKRDLQLGALLPAFFWAAQAGSFAFPGTGGLETEVSLPRIAGVTVNERISSSLILVLLGAGYVLERRHAQREIGGE